jgi:SAM-dependent methyltransferase
LRSIPDRCSLLKEWYRVLKPGGRILFTDAMIISGIITNAEIATRSSIGFYLFFPWGENERLIRNAGFELLSVADLTESTALISRPWHDARARRREDLVRIEGEATFRGLQSFLACTRTLSSERRLSRCGYLARKNGAASYPRRPIRTEMPSHKPRQAPGTGANQTPPSGASGTPG